MQQNKKFWFAGFIIFCALIFLFLNVTSYATIKDSGFNYPDFENGYYFESAPSIETTVLEEVANIRMTLDFVVYTLAPLAIAIFLLWRGCIWFYNTFIHLVF